MKAYFCRCGGTVDTVDSKSAYSDIVLVRVQSSAIFYMKWISGISSIFFDFDGLLVNTEALHFEAYQNMLKKNGILLPWDFHSFLSIAHRSARGLRDFLFFQAPELTNAKTWEGLYQEKKREYLRLLDSREIEWMPGAQNTLEAVRQAGLPHAVVTNSMTREIDIVREKIPALKEIPHWITREQYKRPKPAPDAYLRALAIVGSARAPLGFEDTLKGVHALERSKIPPVLICPQSHPQMKKVSKFPSLYYAPSLTAFLETPLTLVQNSL